MKCENCDNEATVHEVMIQGGKKVEKHLCEQCAMNEGLGIQVAPPISSILSQYITSQSGKTARTATSLACPTCGLTFAQFRKTGLLGCPDCYDAFEEQLAPLLARAHEGGSHHVGKIPKGAGRAVRRRASLGEKQAGAEPQAAGADRRIEMLERRLAEAVAAEQYERAAKLHDELKKVREELGLDEDAATQENGHE